jgi:hypothetical protein
MASLEHARQRSEATFSDELTSGHLRRDCIHVTSWSLEFRFGVQYHSKCSHFLNLGFRTSRRILNFSDSKRRNRPRFAHHIRTKELSAIRSFGTRVIDPSPGFRSTRTLMLLRFFKWAMSPSSHLNLIWWFRPGSFCECLRNKLTSWQLVLDFFWCYFEI